MEDILTEKDKEILAKTIYGEARGECKDGQIAIACCVLNRFNSGKWYAGKTIADTCQKPYQFSCWNENDPNRVKLENLSYSVYSKYFPIIQAALKEDITLGATHYYAPNIVKCPAWAKDEIPCMEIGNHLFFRNIS